MLDTETKRRIDTARDILVGKVPDPKSQVEQITIALIYKFMNDMDAQAEELGGERTFFAGEFEKYSWSKLTAVGMGGYDVVTLYGEAIARMTENQGIPALFRDIFKNAYLPYRDPETLKAFLKLIDDFSYDHSERLGDAFEYLLSVLGSQGDAGQFRTPRHIIDFLVDVIDPQKNETILDPACGTAGFLVSAYKHILNANALDGRPGALIIPDERARLTKNIKGYDISPDMVRLSLVNLYLHGFADPHIYEYDTLTSEDHWNDYADVIMANPPFMSPKGGIRPHKRFSVQSNRSEVLFVDYIAEHLTANGRAAVVVPEGIIFQSGSAYKALRKTLVDNNYLVGVISLPAGVFNPYSGVKTSILWMDRTLATKTDQILFVKVANDGFDLGAQRREIKQNDLPQMLSAIEAYKTALASGNTFEIENPNVTLVEKARLAENGDYNLSGERYREAALGTLTVFPLVEIGELCTFEYGKPLKQEDRISGEYPVFGSNGVVGYHNEYLVQAPFLVVGRKGSAGEVHYSSKNGFPIDTTFFIKLENENRIVLEYLFLILKSLDLKGINVQSGVPGLNRNDAYKIQIPLPPLSIQQEIVAEIEGYQKIIDGARQVVDNYQPRIEIDPAWEMVSLGEHIEFISGLTLSIPDSEVEEGGIPIISMNSITESGELIPEGIREIQLPDKGNINYLQKGDLLFNWRNGSKRLVGKTGYFDWDGDYVFASFLLGIRPLSSSFVSKFLWLLLNQYRAERKYMNFMRQNVNGLFNRDELKILVVPLPDLTIQQRIVAQIEHEQALVKSTGELVALFEKKIKERIARVWGE
ncbi:MAG: N-6 DNA methylase [Anaerolineae bacterium]|nr:N-6 DNA methylase [Anaerolineae bacterium]